MSAVVLRIVCSHCGDAVVGEARRGAEHFEYEPRWIPDTSSRRAAGTVNFSDRWPVSGPVTDRPLTVDCRRHGLLTFDVREATIAARHGTPAKPATIRIPAP